jgi:CheY-like chemotaxis protein
VRLLRATLPGSIAIRTDFGADTPGVRADSTQVHQVVMNLGTNAAHAIGARQGTIEIASEATLVDAGRASVLPDLTEGLYAHVTVRDDGSGMDSEILGRVFEPFFTTKQTGHGTGLGMSVVHGIMKSHDGAVLVESEPGAGTTVHLYFPARAHVPPPSPDVQARVPLGRGEHVLYVDDEEALVFLATRVLGRLGYRVTGRSDPLQAVGDFRAAPSEFDAVVTDVSMPGMSGFEVAKQLLAIRPDLPVVLTSGVVNREDIARAHDLGVRDVIVKPNTTGELGDILHRLLSGRRPGAS